MGDLAYVDVRHDCDRPSTDHLPTFGERYQVLLRWRCPECRQRWTYEATFLHHDRLLWHRQGGPSWRWRRNERRRLSRTATTEEARTDG